MTFLAPFLVEIVLIKMFWDLWFKCQYFKKQDKCYKNSCWYFSELEEIEFDKEYFPSGLVGSKRINNIEKRKYEMYQVKTWLLLAGEKSICTVLSRIYSKHNSIIIKNLHALLHMLKLNFANRYPFKVLIHLGLYQCFQ